MKKYRQQKHVEKKRNVVKKILSKSKEKTFNERIDRKTQKYQKQKRKKIEKCKTCV